MSRTRRGILKKRVNHLVKKMKKKEEMILQIRNKLSFIQNPVNEKVAREKARLEARLNSLIAIELSYIEHEIDLAKGKKPCPIRTVPKE